ncbi:unnamed protein product [Trifolium pratense]|uniref:Uncharacterized protein n=1 Tax=Trifolium pratense TaxID=57577 RepID=A0ACB0K9M8_TRIPR|nr:unnamed protein product [Trifolium pratense]
MWDLVVDRGWGFDSPSQVSSLTLFALMRQIIDGMVYLNVTKERDVLNNKKD